MTENDHDWTETEKMMWMLLNQKLHYRFEIPWVVMGNSLIQEEVIKMEQFAGEFWALLQMTSFHSGSHQDVNDPPSHHTLFILMTSYCSLLLASAFFSFLTIVFRTEWLVKFLAVISSLPSFAIFFMNSLITFTPTGCHANHTFFFLTPISFLP